MNVDPKRAFFDELAPRWEEMIDLPRVLAELRRGLDGLGIAASEAIGDIGCGTGVLAGELLARLGPAGRVEAVDLSPRMLEQARARLPDPRVRFHLADAAGLPLPARSLDRVICFSAWPHFDDPDRVIAQLRRVLRPGRPAHVWHVDSRQTINQIHAGAGEAVHRDLLEPAARLAGRFEAAGFSVLQTVDSEDAYLVTAARGDGP